MYQSKNSLKNLPKNNMATNDFIIDLVTKLNDDNIEYVVMAVQKGKSEHKASAYYQIHSEIGADILLATANEVFSADDVTCLLSDDLISGTLDEEDEDNEIDIDSDHPAWPDDEESE